MKPGNGPAPGFIADPTHAIRIAASDRRWTVRADGVLLADSRRTQVLEETGYTPVVYFPAADVSLDRLARTADQSICPFKGETRYYKTASAKDARPIAWSYPSVFDEVASIKGHIAFYEDRVELLADPAA